MNKTDGPAAFGREHAEGYDERWAKVAPIREALDFLMPLVFMDLPDDASILCVGAGTGVEMISLACAFPGWRFTAVEPSGAMLDVCRRKAAAAGIVSRCEFHEGYLDSLPPAPPFDGATSILVSQFILDQSQRRDFFAQIAKRLRSGAFLINADLASKDRSAAFEGMLAVWLRSQGMPPSSVEVLRSTWEKSVAILPPREVESLIEAGGFQSPLLFYQALFIHTWFAKVSG